MNIFDKIEKIKKENPNLISEIDDLTQGVALSCMQAIVKSHEATGGTSAAWQSIQEAYEVQLNHSQDILPLDRIVPSKVQKDFEEACKREDIKGIEKGLRCFVKIHDDSKNSVLTDIVMMGKLKSFKFFVENDSIQYHPLYKNLINFEKDKGLFFAIAFTFKRKEILKYLILEHHAEFTLQAQEVMTKDKSELKDEMIQIIKNKHLNLTLNITLAEDAENPPSHKI